MRDWKAFRKSSVRFSLMIAVTKERSLNSFVHCLLMIGMSWDFVGKYQSPSRLPSTHKFLLPNIR